MVGTAYIGLGSNLGKRLETLSGALDELIQNGCRVSKISRVYQTEPMYVIDQPPFLNAAAKITTQKSPAEFLKQLLLVEKTLGRRRGIRYGPRPIDLDILLWGEQGETVTDTPQLTIPHPRLLERAFAMVPLAEVADEVIHPVGLRSIGDLAAGLNGAELVVWAERNWYAKPQNTGTVGA